MQNYVFKLITPVKFHQKQTVHLLDEDHTWNADRQTDKSGKIKY